MTRLAVVPIVAAAAFIAGCSPIAGFCTAAAKCDRFEDQFPLGLDIVGDDDDSERICEVQEQGFLNSLNANEESVCHDAATAWEKFLECASSEFSKDDSSSEACKIMSRGNDNPCQGELDNVNTALRDAGDRCSEDQQ